MNYARPPHLLGKLFTFSLAANPSHLEAVNPVVGKVQVLNSFKKKDDVRKYLSPVLLYMEMQLSLLKEVVCKTLGFTVYQDILLVGLFI
jgi:hypothetical protein